jgi:hypothetical protein
MRGNRTKGTPLGTLGTHFAVFADVLDSYSRTKFRMYYSLCRPRVHFRPTTTALSTFATNGRRDSLVYLLYERGTHPIFPEPVVH